MPLFQDSVMVLAPLIRRSDGATTPAEETHETVGYLLLPWVAPV